MTNTKMKSMPASMIRRSPSKSPELRIPAVNTGTSDIVAISFFDRGEYTTIHTADARGNYQEFSVPTQSLIKAAAFLKAK